MFIYLFFIVSTTALILEPVSIANSNVKAFDIAACNNPQTIATQIKNNYPTDISFDDFLQIVAREIALSFNMPDTHLHHLKWDLTINLDIGVLKVIRIDADINAQTIDISVKDVLIRQSLPLMYEPIETCARTGPRRYGIAGPRKRVCSTQYVSRGLNMDEIQQVNKALYDSVPKALSM